MKITPKCGKNGVSDLMFCCSAAGDSAEIADLAVREPHKAKDARGFCLAGIAGDVELIVVNSQAANRMLVIAPVTPERIAETTARLRTRKAMVFVKPARSVTRGGLESWGHASARDVLGCNTYFMTGSHSRRHRC